jgi:hypothetical protein
LDPVGDTKISVDDAGCSANAGVAGESTAANSAVAIVRGSVLRRTCVLGSMQVILSTSSA